MDDFELDASDFGVDSDTSDTASTTEGTATPSAETQEGSEVEGGAQPNADQQTQTEQMFNLRYNHEDRQVPLSELLALGQKGLNYDKVQERLNSYEQDRRIEFVDSLAAQHGMDFNEFIEVFNAERQQAEIDELVQNNIPKEYAEEMVRNREFREQLEREKQEREQKEAQELDFKEFFHTFQSLNGRPFDAMKDQDDIPQEVWQKNQEGVPFKYAYLEHFVNKLQTENAVLRQNKKNSESSPVGSLNAYGQNDVGSDDEFLLGFNSV